MTMRLSNADLGMFFEERHHALAERLLAVAGAFDEEEKSDLDHARSAHRALAKAGLYQLVLPDETNENGGAVDVRGLCLAREMLGYTSAVADSILAVQGLGAHPIVLAGSDAQRRELLPRVASGDALFGFALTEPEAGSDVASLQCSARDEGDHYVLNGEKTFISNAGIATHYTVFANADPASGKRGISAFLVEEGTQGLGIAPIPMSIAHPIGTLKFVDCRVPKSALIGGIGAGLSLALGTLDTFRVSVGAAAVGMARRALSESIARVRSRRQFGRALSEQQTVQGYLADMATAIDASRLLVLRAAHARDTGKTRVPVEAAMAKMFATEAAQRVIDLAVQLHGGLGVTLGSVVERLYREIRPLRIYEGTTEIQRLIIAKELLAKEPIPMIDIRFPDVFNLADYFLFDRIKEGLGTVAALRFGALTYSYDDVALRSRALAHHLVDSSVLPGQRVYIALPDAPPFAWSFFGALAAGAVVTLGNPDAPISDLAHVLDYVQPTAFITIPRVADGLVAHLASMPYLKRVLLAPDAPTGDDPEAPIAPIVINAATRNPLARDLAVALRDSLSDDSPLPATHRDDHAIWLFTSGSTGRPKAAMHTHRDFAWNTEVYAKRTVGYRRGDITVSVPRLFFGYATGTNLMFPFAVGATVGLYSERPTPESLARAISLYRPSVVTNVPTMMGKLLDHDETLSREGKPPLDFSSIRFHLSAGEALPPPLLTRFCERFKNDVYDGIGSAEMFHIYVSNRPGDIKPGSLGRVVEGYEVRILPDDAAGAGATPLPASETGVMWVRGQSVALGYHQDRDKSWETFHGAWCKTGDLFRLDEEGYLWFSGRADDLLKVSGIWVAPMEVEACLMEHPSVALAAVIGAADEGLLKPKAFIVLRESERLRLLDDAKGESRRVLVAELKKHVRERLSKHKYPRWIVFADDLPKNDRGKVDKKTLKEREARGEFPPEIPSETAE